MTDDIPNIADQEKLDPRGLIREAYVMEGLGLAECRSIFLDWALGISAGETAQPLIAQLLAQYGTRDHPMTEVLRAGLEDAAPPRRRGGRAARVSN